MLIGRKMRTRSGDLASCVAEFMTLPDAQRAIARIVVPGCSIPARGGVVRSLSADGILALAPRCPTRRAMRIDR